MRDLPKGWAVCKLGDVIFVKNGYAFKSKTYSSDGISLVRISDIQEGKISLKNSVKIPIHEVKKDFLIFDGDLLIAMSGATTGKMGVYLGIEPCLQNQRVGNFKIRSDRGLDSKFRNFLVFSLRKDIELAAYGGAQPNISASILEDLEVPLPPFNEQCRIVAKLERLLAKVNSCGDRLDKIPTILKRFRQSVLAAACSGRLTADWREEHPDIEPAEEFASQPESAEHKNYLNIFEESCLYDLPSSWRYIPLSKLGKLTGGGTPSKAKLDYWQGTIPWVSAKDMKLDRISDSIDHISDDAINNSSAKKIPAGSILFVVRGMILAHTFPVAITDVILTINQDLKALIPTDKEGSEYLFIAIKSIASNILFATKEATHGTRRIETQVLQNWAIPLPPLAEQKEIVRRVEIMFQKCDQIEARYRKAKAYTDKLTQAILAKAFRGELVPQDPDDEPAEVLLERIKAEKAAATTKPQKTTKKRGKKASSPQQTIPGME